MDDRQTEGIAMAEERRFVSQSELLRVLDDCLWQVERRRVEPSSGPTDAEPAVG